MARIKNVSGEDRIVPWLGGRLVLAGQVVEVPDDESWAFTEQLANWAPADEVAEAIHDEHAAEPEAPQEPAGNASRDAWAEYVLAAGLATEADIADLTRDELRDTYKTEA